MPYFQDDWRLSQRLTLNLDILFDYYQSPYDKNGGLERLRHSNKHQPSRHVSSELQQYYAAIRIRLCATPWHSPSLRRRHLLCHPLVYQLGTEPRNDLIAPRTNSTDASTFKSFTFMESRSITFQVDAFGLLNHPLPNQPNASTAATSNGIITFGGARTLQMSLEVSY